MIENYNIFQDEKMILSTFIEIILDILGFMIYIYPFHYVI